MSKFLKLALLVIPAVLVGAWMFLKNHQIPSEPGWPVSVKRYSTPYGMLRVRDSESGTTLFWYHSDPDAIPVRIEKQDDTHWVVVFEKVHK
jgi:hypothetical protein